MNGSIFHRKGLGIGFQQHFGFVRLTFIFSRYWSPEHLLNHTLGEMGLGLEASEYYRAMPMLRQLSERFVWRMSDRVQLPLIMDQGPCLVNVCLERAFDWMTRGPPEGEITRRIAHTYYAAGLFYSQAEVPFILIEVDGEEWSYMDGEDLGDCVKQGCIVKSSLRQGDPDEEILGANVRMLTLAKLYPDGGHLLLDLDLTQVLWPKLKLAPEGAEGQH